MTMKLGWPGFIYALLEMAVGGAAFVGAVLTPGIWAWLFGCVGITAVGLGFVILADELGFINVGHLR